VLKKTLLILSLFLAFINSAHSENIGQGQYAIFHKNWPCDTNVEHLSTLWNTFGNSFDCAEKLLQKPIKSIEIHLFNQACVRNQNCGSYETLNGYTIKSLEKALLQKDAKLKEKISTEAERASRFLFAKKQKETICYISPILEHNLSSEAFLVAAEWVKPYFPGCHLVNNPVNNNLKALSLPGFIQELHGSRVSLSKPCIANLDGEDISFSIRASLSKTKISETELSAFAKKYSGCEVINLWALEFNGRCQDESTFIDPRERRCFPTNELFKLIQEYANKLSKII